jgi:hypothetical protein
MEKGNIKVRSGSEGIGRFGTRRWTGRGDEFEMNR